MTTIEQIDELLKENARLRVPHIDKNRLCQGCEDWRRFMAAMWFQGWVAFCLFTMHRLALSEKLTNQEFVERLFRGVHHPLFLMTVFGIALLPRVLVGARWNWLLWRHNQPCTARRLHDGIRWVVALVRKYMTIAMVRSRV